LANVEHRRGLLTLKKGLQGKADKPLTNYLHKAAAVKHESALEYEMHLKVETITPKTAKEYLETNVDHQRHVFHKKVSTYAGMMANGEWRLDGQAIKFAKNGRANVLVDGQHRLLAIIESKKPIEMAVIRGLDKDSFWTQDQGVQRTVENYYQIAGEPYGKVASQVAKWLYYRENGGHVLAWKGEGTAPNPGLVAKWGLKKYPDIPAKLHAVSDLLAQFSRKGLGTRNHLAYCYYSWQKLDAILAYKVADYLATGEGNVPTTIISLREYLIAESQKQKTVPVPGSARGAKVMNALNIGWNRIRAKSNNIRRFARVMTEYDKAAAKYSGGGGVHIPIVVAE